MLSALIFAEDILAKRKAARDDCDNGKARAWLADKDAEIRRYAVLKVAVDKPEKELAVLGNALKDESELVRFTAVTLLGRLAGQNPEADRLFELVLNDTDENVRNAANRYAWPFKQKNIRLCDDPSWDYEITLLKSIEIPDDNWRFITDIKNSGHRQNYYLPSFDDSSWKYIKCGYWDEDGLNEYDGYAWYRIRFNMPEKVDCNSVEIRFDAVDESAWVWLNGKYLGCHDIGVEGYNKPFSLDARKEIQYGTENVLVVRVLDRSDGGGIWKPIFVDILK